MDVTTTQRQVRWELLAGLVRKDLRVKYQGSTIGFLWSLANPLLLLVVYTFVFQVVLRSGVPRFGFCCPGYWSGPCSRTRSGPRARRSSATPGW
jgi:ABC-type polysaccharide/polyol phosphate export permease